MRGQFLLRTDAVTVAELRAGCRSKVERRLVAAVTAPFTKTGRLIVPAPGDYDRAVTALSKLRQGGKTLRSPGGALLDGLIAAMAIRSGALLVSLNTGDFGLLATRMPLRFESFDAFRERVGAS